MQSDITLVQKDIHNVSTEWKGSMHFESTVNGHALHFDKLPAHCGQNLGPRPKPVFLSTVAGCSGMEIISILNKMRLKLESLKIDLVGELTNEQPKIYKSVHMIFRVKGQEADKERIERAINLAIEKYCSVISMVRHFAGFTSEIIFA